MTFYTKKKLLVLCLYIALVDFGGLCCQTTLNNTYSRISDNAMFQFSITPPTGVERYRIIKNVENEILQVDYTSSDPSSGTQQSAAGVTFTGNVTTGNLSFTLEDVQQDNTGIYKLNLGAITLQCQSLYILGKPTTPTLVSNTDPEVGGTVTLTCTSGSTTVPSGHGLSMGYNWTVNDPTSGRYTYSTSRHTLTLSDVTKEDSIKEFRCTATELVTEGLTSDSSNLFTINVLYGPDTVTLNPNTVSYTQNEGTTLSNIQCSADCYPSCTYKWTKQGQTTVVSTTGTLSLGSLQRSGAGTYICTATNPQRTGTQTAQVVIIVRYGPDTVTLNPSTVNYTQNEGTTLSNIQCSADCNPSCTYKWTKQGQTTVVSTTGTLSLVSLQRSGAGTYICTATNPQKTRTQTAQVVIIVRYGPDDALINRESPYTVTEGRTGITIGCTADCYPSCSFSWTSITNNSPFGADGVISFANMTRYDAGRYSCIASNTASQYNNVATSTVTVVVNYAPDVTVTTKNVTINDSHVDITCSPSGVPASYTYQPWTQDWISEGRTIPLKTQLGNSSTLTLTDLSYQHSGVYTCRASNGVTESIYDNAGQGDVHLNVESFPIVTEPVVPNGQYHTVSTQLGVSTPTNISVQYYNSGGAPSVTCYKIDNNSRITSAVHSITTQSAIILLTVFTQPVNTSGTMAIVSMTITEQSQLGYYVIVIKNNIGEGIVPVQIIPEGPPFAPEELRVDIVHQTQVSVSWIQGFHGGYDQTFGIQLSLDNATWWNKTSMFGGKDTSVNRFNATVDGLLPGTLYYVRLFSYNQKGKSPFTNTINYTTTDADKGNTSPLSTPVAAIAGGIGAAFFVIIVVAVVFFVLKRRRPTKDGSRKGLELNDNTINQGADDDSNDEVTENPTYDSSGPRLQASQTPSSSTEDNTYAVVTKPKKHLLTQNSKDVYAEMHKPKKDGKEKNTQVNPKKKENGKKGLKDDKKKKNQKSRNQPGGGDVYENAPEAAFGQTKGKAGSYDDNTYENPEDCAIPAQPKKNVNKDGLVYADLSFKPYPKRQGKLVIHGLDDMTEYVQVDFTKKSEPLPDSDEEDQNANTKK